MFVRQNRCFGSFKAILRREVKEMERALDIFLTLVLISLGIGVVAAVVVFIIDVLGLIIIFPF